jgi:hypothetical protein
MVVKEIHANPDAPDAHAKPHVRQTPIVNPGPDGRLLTE